MTLKEAYQHQKDVITLSEEDFDRFLFECFPYHPELNTKVVSVRLFSPFGRKVVVKEDAK